MPNDKSARSSKRLRGVFTEIAVTTSMAFAALAFSAGLFLQAGVGFASAMIAGVVMFLVLLAAYTAFAGSQRAAQAEQQIGDLEQSMQHLADDVQRLGGWSETLGDLESLSQRVDALSEAAAGRPDAGSGMAERSRIDELAAEVERIDSRLEALRRQVQVQAKERHEELTSELRMLETLVKQLAERMAAAPGAAQQARPRAAANGRDTQAVARARGAAQANAAKPAEAARAGNGAQAPAGTQQRSLVEVVRRSIENNRIELHLQPVMTLPQRRVRYYEALSRLQGEAGELLLPEDYLSLAESEGIMPVIDNVMLYRSVQVLRRLEERSSARGVFCNISIHSLLDPEFFPEFIAFMEQNRNLASSMHFEFGQAMIDSCGPIEFESLNALTALGFRFSLDKVVNLDVDFQKLHEQGFRFIKIDADLFLHGMAEARARIHPADMRSYLERYGIQLIITKIEDERSLAQLLDYNIGLGQGYLFSEPRPVRPEVFAAAQGAEAAA